MRVWALAVAATVLLEQLTSQTTVIGAGLLADEQIAALRQLFVLKRDALAAEVSPLATAVASTTIGAAIAAPTVPATEGRPVTPVPAVPATGAAAMPPKVSIDSKEGGSQAAASEPPAQGPDALCPDSWLVCTSRAVRRVAANGDVRTCWQASTQLLSGAFVTLEGKGLLCGRVCHLPSLTV